MGGFWIEILIKILNGVEYLLAVEKGVNCGSNENLTVNEERISYTPSIGSSPSHSTWN